MINRIDVAILAIKATLMKGEENQDKIAAYKKCPHLLYLIKEYNEFDDEEEDD